MQSAYLVATSEGHLDLLRLTLRIGAEVNGVIVEPVEAPIRRRPPRRLCRQPVEISHFGILPVRRDPTRKLS